MRTITGLLLAALLPACGGALRYELKGSQLSPGADATINADVHKERNLTRMDVQAKNLAPAERIGEGATAYVVWARPNFRAQWSRLGALQLTADGRSGSATLTYAETNFDVIVTVEPDPQVATPSQMQLFKQHIGQEKS
jgi:hypothetical protein